MKTNLSISIGILMTINSFSQPYNTGISISNSFSQPNNTGSSISKNSFSQPNNGESSISKNSYPLPYNTEVEFKNYLIKNIRTIDPIEGIWAGKIVDSDIKTDSWGKTNRYSETPIDIRIIIIGENGNYSAYQSNSITQVISNISPCLEQYKFEKIATVGEYLFSSPCPSAYPSGQAFLTNTNTLDFTINSSSDPGSLYRKQERSVHLRKISLNDADIKNAVSSNGNINTSSETISSGSGYAISSDGYIITNYHVTDGAKTIKVRGVNGDFSKIYSAKIAIEDKHNDLSIIKIDDPNFRSLGTVPYVISSRASDVGSSVFVLGYPLRATMGDEVKLTNGIISSKSGFQGDVTSYQITAPVQPGNSGGPLFDDKGNIIGVINAKHRGAENVSYAIKSPYLLNLIDLLPTPPKLQTICAVTMKPLTEQVKILKKFTYIIEIN